MPPIPDDELISAYLDDELSREDRLRAEQLLLDRADLRRLFEEVRSLRQGLRSLPKFALGDEFSAAVLRQAERSVLQGDEAEQGKPSIAPELATGPAPTPPKIAQASQQQQARAAAPVVLADRIRAMRPLIYALTTVAAALAIMFYQQQVREQRDVALAPKGPQSAAAGKDAPNTEARKAATTEARSKPSTATSLEDRDSGVVAAKNGIAPTGDIATGSTTATNSTAATDRSIVANPIAPAPNATAGLMSLNGQGSVAGALDKSAAKPAAAALGAAPPISLPMPTVSLGAPQQVDALASNGAAIDSLKAVALEDNKRIISLADNWAKARRADGAVGAVKLQQLAQAESQQLGEGAADSARRKQAYGYGNELQNQGLASNRNGLLLVNIDCSREDEIEKIARVLDEQKIADFTTLAGNVAGIDGVASSFAKSQSLKEAESGGFGRNATELRQRQATQRELATRVRPDGAGGERPGEPDVKRAEGPAGRAGAGGQLGAVGSKSESDSRLADKRAGEKADAKKEAGEGDVGEGSEYQYVYVVATEEQLGSILKAVRAEPQFYNVKIDATPDIASAYRSLENNRAGQPAEPKGEAPTGLANGRSAVAPRSGNGPAAKAAQLSDPTAPAAAVATKPASGSTATSAAATPSASAPVATAMPKAAAPIANSVAGVAVPAAPAAPTPGPATPIPTTPATPIPGAVPQPPASLASSVPPAVAPPGTMLPGVGPLGASRMTAGQPSADQPIATSELQKKLTQQFESQGYADQRRGLAQSRWQRSSDREIRLFNELQSEAERPNNLAISNPVAEKSPTGEAGDGKSKEAGQWKENSKADDVPLGRGNLGKIAGPTGAPPTASDAEAKRAEASGAGARPAKRSDSSEGTSRIAQSTKDEAGLKLRDSQAGGGPPGNVGGGSGVIGGSGSFSYGNSAGGQGFVPAPPMLPAQQQAAPTQQAAPEDVLGKIGGVQQPPPLVQQAMPQLAPNRIRGVAQEEQAASRDALPLSNELPPGYQEALFVFRVVKSKDGGNTQAGEADATQEAKPAKQ